MTTGEQEWGSLVSVLACQSVVETQSINLITTAQVRAGRGMHGADSPKQLFAICLLYTAHPILTYLLLGPSGRDYTHTSFLYVRENILCCFFFGIFLPSSRTCSPNILDTHLQQKL